MKLLPMDLPAELHRRAIDPAIHVTVARGPLVIMAYGLMAIDPAERDGFWITSPLGELKADAAEEVLREWNTRRRS
jgi:hypothetical protein